MARYVTNFKLKSAVNDFGAAKKYLADADMTKYLIDDLRDYENMPELADKIVHIEWNLEEDWYGTINLETTEDISKQDLAVILEWVKGQNSDGLGEGFEQRNFARFYDEKRGRYYLASFIRRLPQFTKVSDSYRINDSAIDVEDAVYNAIMEASPAVQDAIVEIVYDNYDLSKFESTEDLSNTIWNDIDYLASQLSEDLQEDFADTYGY